MKVMKKIIKTGFACLLILFSLQIALLPKASDAGYERLAGRILLQVQSNGEAWYVNPADSFRYNLGRPADAFNIMQLLGLGATHEFISGQAVFPARVSGRILLDVEKHGEAYYINPLDLKSYYLGRPADSFELMKKFGLGITNHDLSQISIGRLAAAATSGNCTACRLNNPDDTINGAADAISNNDIDSALHYFTPDMREAVKYGLENLDSEGIYDLATIFRNVQKTEESPEEIIYSAQVYFALNDSMAESKLTLKKQADGNWLLYGL